MRTRLYGLLAIALITVMSGAECSLDGGSERDFSDFTVFEFTQSPALGFCPNLEIPYQVTIQKLGDGSYQLDMSVLDEGESGADECLEDVISDTTCIIVRELATRQLTTSEIERVRSVFSSVLIKTEIYPSMCIDPCLIDSFVWDDFSIDAEPVGCISGAVDILDSTTFNKIIILLNELRIGPVDLHGSAG